MNAAILYENKDLHKRLIQVQNLVINWDRDLLAGAVYCESREKLEEYTERTEKHFGESK